MGVATEGNWALELTPGFRKVYVDKYAKIPNIMEQVFKRTPSLNPYEEDWSSGTFGDPNNFTEDGEVHYDSPQQGFRSRYVHTEWTLGFEVQYRLWQDSKSGRGYNTIEKMPKLMGTSMARAREKRAAAVFNNGATLGMTDATGPGDSKALFATDHPIAPGSATTWSNKGTTPLSQAAVEAACVLMAQYPDDRGNLIGINPRKLLVPRGKVSLAREIIGTPGQSYTANNTINTLYESLEIIPWDYLTLPYAWYLIDSDMAEEQFLWFDREENKFMDTDFDTLNAKWMGYERNSVGFSDPHPVYASYATS